MRKLPILFALATAVLLSPAAARTVPPITPPSLAAADKAHVLSDTFTTVKTVKQLPAAVQKALGLPAKDPLGGMADAGQKFQESDVIKRPELPSRRLVFAAVNASYCLVYLESGGFMYRQQVILYRLRAGQAVWVWGTDLNSPKGTLTFAQLRAAIKDGRP